MDDRSTRLYFWFRGVDVRRPGGPWWYRDFPSLEEMAFFLNDARRFLTAWAILGGGPFPRHDPMRIAPPREVPIEWAGGPRDAGTHVAYLRKIGRGEPMLDRREGEA